MPANLKLTVTVHGVEKVIGNLNRLNIAAGQRVRDQVAKSALAVQRGARQRAPVDTGRLRSSIQPQFYRGGLSAEVGSAVKYAPFIEFGTRPHFPPVRALRGWARRVLKDESLAFVVARAISKRGTLARPFLFPAWEEERPRFERGIAQALKQAVQSAGRGA